MASKTMHLKTTLYVILFVPKTLTIDTMYIINLIEQPTIH